MSDKAQILRELEEAGSTGVHSFSLLRITPRYSARICELNKEGYEISSVREKGAGDAVGTRYTLVGSGSGEGTEGAPQGLGDSGTTSSESDGEGVGNPQGPRGHLSPVGALPSHRSVPSMFDADDCVQWGDAA